MARRKKLREARAEAARLSNTERGGITLCGTRELRIRAYSRAWPNEKPTADHHVFLRAEDELLDRGEATDLLDRRVHFVRLVTQRRDTRQLLSLKKFQGRTTPGGAVGYLVLRLVHFACGCRVATFAWVYRYFFVLVYRYEKYRYTGM